MTVTRTVTADSHVGAACGTWITHRLANVRHADRIFVLHHGRLVEAGSHDDLIATGGRYAELFTLQAAGYDATPSEDSPVPQQHLTASR